MQLNNIKICPPQFSANPGHPGGSICASWQVQKPLLWQLYLYFNFYSTVYCAGNIVINASEGTSSKCTVHYSIVGQVVPYSGKVLPLLRQKLPLLASVENVTLKTGEIFYSSKLITIHAYAKLLPNNVITYLLTYSMEQSPS
jgi:hypothetical protein